MLRWTSTGSSPNFSTLTRSGIAIADDGVRLYYEETGSGIPVIFVHEFAGDRRSWEPQGPLAVALLPLYYL